MPATYHKTELEGVLIVEPRIFGDSRGFLIEAYNQAEWNAQGLEPEFVQDNLSCSAKGTLRGMHYQLEPWAMGKFVRVISGSIFDVAVDLRADSPSFGKWTGCILSSENMLGMWIPSGFAHGFLALEDDSRVYYKSTNVYTPDAERSVAWNDSEVGIDWPFAPVFVSDKDVKAPVLCDAEYNFKCNA